ncbi:hypothetical protein DAERI_090049 [Deinococcus aerius]|uniref:DUF4149 domain-containing protein n=1 Tax=Deinococcus aerius TaxID=200253 RepID=A0A2I9CWR9_9DEIO|nr:hypothetical protein [Deinococcus aerius]GBF06463.1 hypothetical protein DAERI_090049 [Deinococcus aerius]
MTPLVPLLAALNVLLVGVWVGMYLFTTSVVSPAFTELFPDAATRTANRRLVGRYYARVNGPLTLLLLATVLALGVTRGFGGALLAEFALLLLIGGLVALHVRRGQAQARPPAWITNLTLAASALLCAFAVVASA